jgi:hypothetical protein
VAYSQPVIESGSTKTGRWLRERRVRLALWFAVFEGVIVAVSPELTRWTVFIIAVLVLAFYALAGRRIGWDVGRQLSWIAAASQAIALLVVVFAAIAKPLALIALGIVAVVALVYLFSEAKRT